MADSVLAAKTPADSATDVHNGPGSRQSSQLKLVDTHVLRETRSTVGQAKIDRELAGGMSRQSRDRSSQGGLAGCLGRGRHRGRADDQARQEQTPQHRYRAASFQTWVR